jgi:hypothetical protein
MTILLPSGDHAGAHDWPLPRALWVSLVLWEPSRRIQYTFADCPDADVAVEQDLRPVGRPIAVHSRRPSKSSPPVVDGGAVVHAHLAQLAVPGRRTRSASRAAPPACGPCRRTVSGTARSAQSPRRWTGRSDRLRAPALSGGGASKPSFTRSTSRHSLGRVMSAEERVDLVSSPPPSSDRSACVATANAAAATIATMSASTGRPNMSCPLVSLDPETNPGRRASCHLAVSGAGARGSITKLPRPPPTAKVAPRRPRPRLASARCSARP